MLYTAPKRLTPYSLDKCCIFQYRTQMNIVRISSHTHWLSFHYETYVGIIQYRTPLYYMYKSCMYTCCIESERGMLLTERRRFTTLWSSVMSVGCTLLCAVESVGQSCEKIQTVFIFMRYEKIQHMSKE